MDPGQIIDVILITRVHQAFHFFENCELPNLPSREAGKQLENGTAAVPQPSLITAHHAFTFEATFAVCWPILFDLC